MLLCAAGVAVAGGGAALAIAATSGGPEPPRKPLAEAIHDALSSPPPNGVTARIEFTNHLLASGSFEGADPLLTGATGRLWASFDGRFRLELQSSNAGDAQVVSDGHGFWIYDATSRTVYRGKLPGALFAEHGSDRPPTLARIDSWLTQLGERAIVSGATPDNVAGMPAYTARVEPRSDGGLVSSAALAWDAARGVPLRFGLYAKGDPKPVLELKATDISFGPVPSGALDLSPPAGAKSVDLMPHEDRAGAHKGATAEEGVAAVRDAVRFKLASPPTLAGLRRHSVRLIGGGERENATAAVVYGRGLGAIVVVQHAAAGTSRGGLEKIGPLGRVDLPQVSIGGVRGEELDTALGTVIRFQRDGVDYTVLGSVTPDMARAAARGI